MNHGTLKKKNHLYVKTNSLLVKQVTKTQALARAVELKMSLRGLCFIWEAILSLQRLVRAITIRSTLSLDGNWVLMFEFTLPHNPSGNHMWNSVTMSL